MRGERGAIDAAIERGGPTPERRHTCPAFIRRDFAAAHAGVEQLHAEGAAVVGQENDERILLDPPFFELLQQRAEIIVEVLDHSVESGGVLRDFAFVAFETFVRHLERRVGGIQREIGEERRPALSFLIHPRQRLSKEHVRAIASGLLEPAVVENGRIEIGVAGRVAATTRIRLPDSPAAMNEHLVETAPVRPAILFVAQVPLAEDAGRVAGVFQHLGDSGGFERQALALVNGVRDAVLELMPPGHQRRAGRRAGRADVKIREADAFLPEHVRSRRADDRIAQTGVVAVADVVRHDDDDVRAFGQRSGGPACSNQR